MSSHCQEFVVPEGVIIPADEGVLTSEELATGYEYLLSKGISPQWGDLVLFEGSGDYRNAGVSICDGTRLLDLDGDHDDYGALPPTFTVLEGNRPLTYWAPDDAHRGICHNSIIWFPYHQYQEELEDNITYGFDDQEGKYMLWSFFYHQGIGRKVVYDYADYVYDETHYLPEDLSLSHTWIERIKGKFVKDLRKRSFGFGVTVDCLPLHYESPEYQGVSLYMHPTSS